MSVDTILGSVIIDGNTFDYSAGPPVSSYATCVTTNSDAVITNNYFSGVGSGSTQHINAIAFDASTSTLNVANNTFVRGETTIASYINISATTNDSVIVNNIFDNPTVDGANQTLVILPTLTASGPFILYERNKNQTGVMQIQKSSYLISKNNVPTINGAERAIYTDDLNLGYAGPSGIGSSGGYYQTSFPGISPNFFLHEGVGMNYITPFSFESGVKLPGTFDVTNGSTSVSPFAIGPYVFDPPALSSFVGWIVFGNDNTYYSVTGTAGTNTSPPFNAGAIISMTLGASYTGQTRKGITATYFPASGSSAYSALSYILSGTFGVIGSSANVSATVSQTSTLVPGSQICFNDATGDIYTVKTINAAGTSITLTTNYAASTASGLTASTGAVLATFDFSINLSEILPPNVQVLSTVFGVYGNNNIGSMISAGYGATISIDNPTTPYATNLSGTFTVNNGNSSVTASISQTGSLSPGSSICFASQSYIVYQVLSVAGTSITLTANFSGTSGSTTAVKFDSSLSDAANNSNAAVTTIGFGDPIAFSISGNSPGTFASTTQYLKIDPPAFGIAAFTGVGRLIRYNLNISVLMAAPGNLFLPESPLIVQYRW